MRLRLFSAAALAVLVGGGAAHAKDTTVPRPDPLAAVVAGTNEFAHDLEGKLAARPGNHLVSPVSIALALAMVREGARGETASEIDGVLHVRPEEAEDGWRLLAERLTAGSGAAPTDPWRLRLANALWAQEGLRVREPFLDRLREAFAAPLQVVDFAGPTARAAVDGWVDRATDRMIPTLGPLDTSTRLLVANAVSFKARWRKTFEERSTSDAPFRVAKDREVTVRLLWGEGRFRYGETERAQVLELPYAGDAWSMLLVLPKDVDGLAEVEARETLEDWTASLKERTVWVRIPKLRMHAEVDDLETVLSDLGMSSAFDAAQADLTGIAPGLWIGSVAHKAFLTIDEQGTEAAAVTAARTRGGDAFDLEDAEWFVATHPFLLSIRHRETGLRLFLGRVVDPSAP